MSQSSHNSSHNSSYNEESQAEHINAGHILETSVVNDHFHTYKLGKIRTSEFVNQKEQTHHHHTIIYVNELPVIGLSEGHRHKP